MLTKGLTVPDGLSRVSGASVVMAGAPGMTGTLHAVPHPQGDQPGPPYMGVTEHQEGEDGH